MSAQGDGVRRGDSFRRPASYGREAWTEAGPQTAQESAGDVGGTRAFSPEELDDASAASSEDATTLLGARGAAGARRMEPRQPQRQAPQPSGPGVRNGRAPYVRGGQPQAPRADQTLVSPLAQERIRAEVHVPDPAYPPQRAQAARQVPPAYGTAPAAYHVPAEGAQETPLRRRRQPQRPPVAQQGYGYQQPVRQVAYPQQGYQAQPQAEEPGRGHGLARGVLLLVSWLLRLAALGLVALVVVNCFTMGNRVAIMRLTAQVSQLLPRSLAGLYVLDSPFGGVFRGDFAIAAVVLFVLDWIVARVRRRLR